FVERWPQGGKRLRGGARPHAFVGVEQHRVAFALRDLDRDDLFGQLAVFDRGGGPLVGGGGQLVLRRSLDVGRRRVLLRCAAHGDLVEGAEQTVEGDRIDERAVAVAVAAARA